MTSAVSKNHFKLLGSFIENNSDTILTIIWKLMVQEFGIKLKRWGVVVKGKIWIKQQPTVKFQLARIITEYF